ncbi:hypothetical protein LZ31DRAFT_590251 [Colletotrichum somersetense]|nr:hypothetical protein LZ31DRAFT_590251 [Colletotrichum somersetense]
MGPVPQAELSEAAVEGVGAKLTRCLSSRTAWQNRRTPETNSSGLSMVASAITPLKKRYVTGSLVLDQNCEQWCRLIIHFIDSDTERLRVTQLVGIQGLGDVLAELDEVGEVGEDGRTALTAGRVKKPTRKFNRRFNAIPENGEVKAANDASKKQPVICNGQYSDGPSCLRDYAVNGQRTTWSRNNCPDTNPVLDNQAEDGETVAPCGNPSRRYHLPGHAKRQQDGGGTCPLLPTRRRLRGIRRRRRGGPHGVLHVGTHAVADLRGGLVWTGFFCNPRPPDSPPDKHDPKDPSGGGGSVPTKTIDEPNRQRLQVR